MSLPDDLIDRSSNLSEAKQALLARWLHSDSVDKTQSQEIPRRSGQGSFPLSSVQQRLWFINQLDPDNPAYNITLVVSLMGQLQIAALEQSLNTLAMRHEALRTTFALVNNAPAQMIAPTLHLHLRLLDLLAYPASQRDAQARQLMAQEVLHPFNLQQGPLVRCCLLRLENEAHLLQIVMQHMISDGSSLMIFLREWLALYSAAIGGQPALLPELPVQYADFALWQQGWLQGEVLERQVSYWKQHLEGADTVLDLPTDRPRPALQTFRGASLLFELPQSWTDQARVLCAHMNCTLFQILFAAFQTLLSRYTRQMDFLIGTPIANRTRPETEGLIGLFANILVLRTSLTGNPTLRELISRVRDETLEAYAHQDVPFEKVVEVVQPKRDLSRNPLIQVMFSFMNNETLSWNTDDLEVSTVRTDTEAVPLDLTLSMSNTETGVKGAIEYNTDLFDAATISRLADHLQTLLVGCVTDPDQHVSAWPMLTQEERKQLLFTWNATEAAYPLQKTFHQLFAEQVARTPDAPALVSGTTMLTYRELQMRSLQMARLLGSHGVNAEALVGIYMERSPEMVVAILATFQAGGAYVPLDPAYPAERLALILQDARPRVIVTQPQFQAFLPAQVDKVITVDPTWQVLSAQSGENIRGDVEPEQLAYVIFTSGSTGKPKGVMITHRGMLNHLYAKISSLHIAATDRVAQIASHCFDISVWQFFSALLVGAQVHILPDEIIHNPERLWEQALAARLTIVEIVPSLLRALLDTVGLHIGANSHLRWLIATGEALPIDVCQRWLQVTKTVPLVNAYGPTECSDDVTQCLVENPDVLHTASAPIGHALANTQIYILDSQLTPVPIGVPGQVYVGGTGVGRGYLTDPARTAAVFLPDPFSGTRGTRLYQTGDLARYLGDGNIEFLGRIDHQVKLRGFRIELGEIEAVLHAHPQVRSAVVLLREKVLGRQRLVAYVVLVPGQPSEHFPSEIRQYLKAHLPEYMVPTVVMPLPVLPLTPNGKIDRHALPEPEEEDLKRETTYSAPGSTLERTIAQVWQEVLALRTVGIQENFFDLGGHSLLMVQVYNRLRASLPAASSLSMIEMFRYPTVAALAEHIGQNRQDTSASSSLSTGQNQAQNRREALKRLRQRDQAHKR